MKANYGCNEAYSSLKKDHGPPHKHFNKLFDPLDKNEYLLNKGIDIEALRNVHGNKHVQA